jgi:hypothetical protein
MVDGGREKVRAVAVGFDPAPNDKCPVERSRAEQL